MRFDKNVPLPPARQEYTSYEFDAMEVGDSFYVADPDGKTAHRLQTQMSYRKRFADTGKRFTTRRVPDGVRVWRIS